jgi:hypothetical protein
MSSSSRQIRARHQRHREHVFPPHSGQRIKENPQSEYCVHLSNSRQAGDDLWQSVSTSTGSEGREENEE